MFLSRVALVNFVTRAGDLDLAFTPAGTAGFPDPSERAIPMILKGVTVLVADLDDVIRSKQAANRPKDHRTLPALLQLLEEIRRRD